MGRSIDRHRVQGEGVVVADGDGGGGGEVVHIRIVRIVDGASRESWRRGELLVGLVAVVLNRRSRRRSGPPDSGLPD